jgi:polysaccharide pyruvyl transferase WcaK-like protein
MSEIFAIVYANLKGNLGDFAILHSMLADIRSRAPDSTIHVYSQPFVSIDEERLEAFKQSAPPFEHMGTTYPDDKPLGQGMSGCLRAVGCLRLYQDWRISRLARKASTGFGKRFSQYKAVFVAGGAQWTGLNSGVSMFANLRAIAACNAEIYSYPVSVSSSLWKVNGGASLSRDLSLIKPPLIARDSQTHRMFQELKLDAVLGADCVFAAPKPASFSAAEGERKRVLFVLTSQPSDQIEAAVIRTQNAGLQPVLLSTCAIEDEPVQKKVADRLGVDFIAPLTWQGAVSAMQSSAIVVTNRLHGLILASFSQSSVVPLVDRPKVRAVVQDARLPVSVNALADLNAATLSLAQDYANEIRQKLASYKEKALHLPWSPLQVSGEG